MCANGDRRDSGTGGFSRFSFGLLKQSARDSGKMGKNRVWVDGLFWFAKKRTRMVYAYHPTQDLVLVSRSKLHRDGIR